MKFIVRDIIFTDRTKAGQPLINKNKEKFFMLHLEVKEVGDSVIQSNEHGKWISKYYITDEWDKLKDQIKIGETYLIEYSQSWIYKNVQSVRTISGNIII